MLERGDVLRTWRLGVKPENGNAIPSQRIADHRPFYLDYEGPVSGDRGSVLRIASGLYEIVDEQSDKEQQACLTVILNNGNTRQRCDIYETEIRLSGLT